MRVLHGMCALLGMRAMPEARALERGTDGRESCGEHAGAARFGERKTRGVETDPAEGLGAVSVSGARYRNAMHFGTGTHRDAPRHRVAPRCTAPRPRTPEARLPDLPKSPPPRHAKPRARVRCAGDADATLVDAPRKR